MGLLQNSTRGLGHVSVRGLSLVPKPPTRIIAFRCADVAFVMMLAFGWMQGQEREVREAIDSNYECREACGSENSSLGLLSDDGRGLLFCSGQGCHFGSCATVVASVTGAGGTC